MGEVEVGKGYYIAAIAVVMSGAIVLYLLYRFFNFIEPQPVQPPVNNVVLTPVLKEIREVLYNLSVANLVCKI